MCRDSGALTGPANKMNYLQRVRVARPFGCLITLFASLGVGQNCLASSCSSLPADVARVVSQLTAGQRYTVQCGSVVFPVNVAAANCTEGQTYSPNPSSCYGQYNLPGRTGGTASSTYQLDNDEAVLFIGQTPPSAYYYGFQSYVYGRFNPLAISPQSPYINIFASIGPAVNERTTASYPARTQALAQLFSNSTTMISTANKLTQSDIANSLPYLFSTTPTPAQITAAQAMTNVEIFPSDLMSLGSALPADLLKTFIRLTPFTVNATGTTFGPAALAYMSQPPSFIFRVSPVNARLNDSPNLYVEADDPLPTRKVHPSLPNDIYEQDLLTAAGVANAQIALNVIIQNVITDRQVNWGLTVVGQPMPLVAQKDLQGRYCIAQFNSNLQRSEQSNNPSYIDNTPLCSADSPDADYLWTGSANVTLATGGQIVIVGINHGTLGSGTYSSIALQQPVNDSGNYAVAMTNLILNGSASAFLGSIPVDAGSDFYVASFQEDCANISFCRVAPPSAPGSVTPLTFVERNYLGPTTGTMPAYSDIFVPTLIAFAPQ